MILGDSVITALNGPYLFTSLGLNPMFERILPTKYIIFLGDEHNYTNHEKCDFKGCFEIIFSLI